MNFLIFFVFYNLYCRWFLAHHVILDTLVLLDPNFHLPVPRACIRVGMLQCVRVALVVFLVLMMGQFLYHALLGIIVPKVTQYVTRVHQVLVEELLIIYTI